MKRIILVSCLIISLVKSMPMSVDLHPQERIDQDDLQSAASDNAPVRLSIEDSQDAANEVQDAGLAPLDNIDISEDENRNKRFLSFGNSNGDASSGGGSGNFIFDIVRLITGASGGSSGGTASTDAGASTAKSEEAVPGPVTRLLVITNRGISNLVQDLILRIAATSERFVNFKARLITALI